MSARLSNSDRRDLLARYRKLLAHYELVPEHRRDAEAADATTSDLRTYIAELEDGLDQLDTIDLGPVS
jgi:hypothetical protein